MSTIERIYNPIQKNLVLGTKFVEQVEANAIVTTLGKQLVEAFHKKSDPKTLETLVKVGAPVNYRLDYGLEVKLEADFVFAFYRILGGDQNEESLMRGCEIVFGNHANDIFEYTRTSPQFFEILYNEQANQEIIPTNPDFIENLKANPNMIRANPEHTNGSLIIAAGLRDGKLVKDLLKLGQDWPKENNGANVNFVGYFDVPAAVWSAILFDEDTLSILLEAGTSFNLSVCGSNLLHWACAAAGLDKSTERKERAFRVIQRLVSSGVSTDETNKLGKKPYDYAPDYLRHLVTPRI